MKLQKHRVVNILTRNDLKRKERVTKGLKVFGLETDKPFSREDQSSSSECVDGVLRC